MEAIADRLQLLPTLELDSGNHESFESGHCAMELVSWLAGEPFSDHPACACPVISTFMRSWNDGLPDDERTLLLRPLLPKLIGTRSTTEVELARVMLCVDWLCREFTPAWLDLVPALKPHAEILRAAKPIQSCEDFDAIVAPIRAAQKDADAARVAWDAAWDAARAAAWDASWDAARAAAWDASWDAARAASWGAAWAATRDAAWNAARAATRGAAWAATRDAAWDALKPTKERLQQSAVGLVERMIAVK